MDEEEEDWEIVPPPKQSTLIASSSSTYPTTLADLATHHDPEKESLYKSLKTIRRSTLSIHNRLASIFCDSHFVTNVASHYDLPLIANERCGSWYIPTELKKGSAYFKSTDGHHGQWSFSTRRLNLGVLEVLGRAGGAVLVDSTRRGKKFSDALSKTVPIWCAVWNRVLFGDESGVGEVEVWEGVGSSERSQIESRMSGWVEELRGLGLDLEGMRRNVKRRLRCRWVVNGEWDGCDDEEDKEWGERGRDYNLLVLCSASRRVKGAEASEGGYVQGSGDDHEGWSCGLTPDVFWRNRELLMDTDEGELPELIGRLMKEKEENEENEAVCIDAVGNIWLGRGARSSHEGWDLVINCQSGSVISNASILDLECREGKLGSKDLRLKLPAVQSVVATTMERKPQCRILVTCNSGKDLSVGVAVALFCMYYGDDGKPWTVAASLLTVDKQLVKKRLAWISSSKLDANPSRATLQAVNSFLMDRPG